MAEAETPGNFFSRECPATGQTCIMADCKRVCQALREGDRVKPDFRWLIEAPGQRYLGVREMSCRHDFIWTQDHNNALAFRSEKQADQMMSALRDMDRKLFGFDETLGPARAIEHGWMAPPEPAAHKDSQREDGT